MKSTRILERCKKSFAVVCPHLVNPHIGAVACRDAVAEPLMRALVYDDEFEPPSDADFWSSQIAILEMIAVGDCGLNFDAGVKSLDELIAISGERILAEVVLVALQHILHLDELPIWLFQIFRKHVVIQGKPLVSVAKVDILSYVQRYVIVIDRVLHDFRRNIKFVQNS
jgi:hypothetical protein